MSATPPQHKPPSGMTTIVCVDAHCACKPCRGMAGTRPIVSRVLPTRDTFAAVTNGWITAGGRRRAQLPRQAPPTRHPSRFFAARPRSRSATLILGYNFHPTLCRNLLLKTSQVYHVLSMLRIYQGSSLRFCVSLACMHPRVEPIEAGQGRALQGRAVHGTPGACRAGQGKARPGKAGQGRALQGIAV